MAHESALTQASNIKDEEESMTEADLEEGEIEDGELPEEGEVQTPDETPPVPKTEQAPVQVPVVPPPVKKERRVPMIPRPPRRHPPQHHRRQMGPRIYHEPRLMNDDSETEEDDWASNVEKALKAALAGTEAATGPASSTSPNATTVSKNETTTDNEEKDENRTSSDDERRLKKKKRKKKHREENEDEDDKRDSKKRRKSHHKDVWEDKDEQGDEDEMLFVRGASPNTRSNFHPEGSPSRNFGENSFFGDQGAFDEAYDSYHEEGSDYEARDEFPVRRGARGSDEDSLRRNIGRGAKRRMRGGSGSMGRGGGDIGSQRGGHHMNKRMPLSRKDVTSGKNIGKMRGGMRRIGGRDNRSDVCMFFMQGKCHKGEDCPYSHDALPARKNELCKFYLMDCCAKKDKCLYLHESFPCKFFHTGLKCYSGARCKFSHGPLSEQMRTVLMKHLETAPKDLLGDYPRVGRDSNSSGSYHKRRDNERGDRPDRNDRERDRERERDRSERVERGERSDRSDRSSVHRSGNGSAKRGSRSIPSLFDIEVPIHVQRLAEQKDVDGENSPARRSTPMPESENEDGTDSPTSSSKLESRPSRSKENRWVSDNSMPSGHNKEFNAEKTPERKNDSDVQHDVQRPTFRFYQDTLSSDEGEHRKGDDKHRKREHKSKRESHHKRSKLSPDASTLDESVKSKSFSMTTTDEKSSNSEEISIVKSEPQDEKPQKIDSAHDARDSQAETGESGTESNDGANIPLHLPKKQRELFLRIQQQQREADSSQERSGDNEDDDDNCADENWYSSDEEDVPLTDLLKKLSNQEPQPPKQQILQDEQEQKEMTPPKSVDQTSAPVVPSVTGLTLKDLSQINISESVTKLLSTIRNQGVVPVATSIAVQTSTVAMVTQTPERTTISTPIQSPQQQGSPVIRDPRVSRDPRSRAAAVAAVAAAAVPVSSTSGISAVTAAASVGPGPPGLLSPSTSSSAPSEAPAPPTRRPDPRTARADPRKAAAAAAAAAASASTSSVGASPGGDDSHSKGILSGPPPRRTSFTSIYSNAITSPGDVDLRNLPRMTAAATTASSSTTGDVDLRHVGDTDFRHITGFGGSSDTDLRPRISADPSAALSGDVDLRRVLELPFKPVPMHTPATEIDASLTSHPPIPYKVVEITIPRPDYTRLKLSTSDPQAENDPRLRKIFKLPDPPVTTSSKTSTSCPTTTTTTTTTTTPRTDPRRLATPTSASSNAASVKSTVPHTAVTVSSSTVVPAPEPNTLGVPQSPFGNVGDLGVGPVGMVMPGVGTMANVDPRLPRTPAVNTGRQGLLGVAPPGFPVAPNPALAVGMRMPFFPVEDGDGGHWNPMQPHQQRPIWRGMRRNVPGAFGEQDMVGGQTFTPSL
ncbi:uncharacterized protein LOC126284080 isoform X3 [Schistocerca gregaria]|uniref:uncharacterized protein LOC126284080 isoform X3 n=1 Tax=Schistocerca gregaria TaxID=7010 RepID=UPI00211EA69F|nr:uncharacterized protein LOC126284080 isoform X3 [Schistocerca gregaria]